MSELTHTDYMKLALELACRGRGTVSPNPMVGCVIVNQDGIVGQGYHAKAGEPHAEIYALREAGERARGATAYVTLEPCCHFGRTSPCTNALIEAGIKKVYAACVDPNPLMAGKGLQQLRDAGIHVDPGLLQKEAVALNEIFFHFIRTRKPFVIAKWAMSLDGKTVTHPFDSRDISNAQSREFSHQIRQQVDAVLIGANTAINDNPQLTARYPETSLKQPLRIVLSSQGNVPHDLKLFSKDLPGKTLLVSTTEITPPAPHVEVLILAKNIQGRVDLHELLSILGKRGITSLLVEGGMTVLQDFFSENLVNKIHVYLAPAIIGSLKQKQSVFNLNMANLDSDFFISADYKEQNHV